MRHVSSLHSKQQIMLVSVVLCQYIYGRHSDTAVDEDLSLHQRRLLTTLTAAPAAAAMRAAVVSSLIPRLPRFPPCGPSSSPSSGTGCLQLCNDMAQQHIMAVLCIQAQSSSLIVP